MVSVEDLRLRYKEKPSMKIVGCDFHPSWQKVAVRLDPGFSKEYKHRCHRKPKGVAKVAAARKLAVRLYWMLRTNTEYPAIAHIESSPRVALVGES